MTLNHVTHSTYLANEATVNTVDRDSDKLRGARVWQYGFQNGLCWDCGLALGGYLDEDGVNFSHLVGGQKKGHGFVPGNVPLGHRRCNVLQARAFGTVVPWSYIAPRVSRIANSWPDRKTLVRLGNEANAERANDDSNRVSNMLAECDI